MVQSVSDHNQPLVPSYLAQLPLPTGKFQKDTVTSSPFNHFQPPKNYIFHLQFGDLKFELPICWSLTAPIQYCPCESLRCLLHNSQLMNPTHFSVSHTINGQVTNTHLEEQDYSHLPKYHRDFYRTAAPP